MLVYAKEPLLKYYANPITTVEVNLKKNEIKRNRDFP